MDRRDFLKLAPRFGLAAVAAQFIPLFPGPQKPETPAQPFTYTNIMSPLPEPEGDEVRLYPDDWREVEWNENNKAMFLSHEGLYEYRGVDYAYEPDKSALIVFDAESRRVLAEVDIPKGLKKSEDGLLTSITVDYPSFLPAIHTMPPKRIL